MPRVPELRDHDEDPVCALTLELDVLPVRTMNLAAGLALGLVREGLLQSCVVALLHRAAKVVRRALSLPLLVLACLALIRHGGRRQRKGQECNRERAQ